MEVWNKMYSHFLYIYVYNVCAHLSYIIYLSHRISNSVRSLVNLTLVEWKRIVMAHAQKPDLVFQRNGRVHLYRRGCQFSRVLAFLECGSAENDCSNTEWTVPSQTEDCLATHSIRLFPLHFSSRASPCATRFRFHYTFVERLWPFKLFVQSKHCYTSFVLRTEHYPKQCTQRHNHLSPTVHSFFLQFYRPAHIYNTCMLSTTDLVLREWLRLDLYQLLDLTNHPVQIEQCF